MVYNVLLNLFEALHSVSRLATATFLLAMGFYLQIIAETSKEPDAEPIPWQFRILPAFLGFFILHSAGRIDIYPVPGHLAAAVLYISLLIIVVKMFMFLMEVYGMESPRNRVPEFVCEAVGILRTDDE